MPGPVTRVGFQSQVPAGHVFPGGQPRPVGCGRDSVIVGQEGIGEKHGELLLAGAVEQAQAPGHRAAVTVQPAHQLRASSTPPHAQRRRRRMAFGPAVLADAQVKVGAPEMHSEIAVHERDRRRRTGAADLEGGPLDDRAEDQAVPVLGEDKRDQFVQKGLPGGQRIDFFAATAGTLRYDRDRFLHGWSPEPHCCMNGGEACGSRESRRASPCRTSMHCAVSRACRRKAPTPSLPARKCARPWTPG